MLFFLPCHILVRIWQKSLEVAAAVPSVSSQDWGVVNDTCKAENAFNGTRNGLESGAYTIRWGDKTGLITCKKQNMEGWVLLFFLCQRLRGINSIILMASSCVSVYALESLLCFVSFGCDYLSSESQQPQSEVTAALSCIVLFTFDATSTRRSSLSSGVHATDFIILFSCGDI